MAHGCVWMQALEGGTEESAGMGPTFDLQAGHLSAMDAKFFTHWHRLLDLEEGGSSNRRADIWRLSGASKTLTRRARLRMHPMHERSKAPSEYEQC